MKHEKGFTLIELLVTISVLAILSTVGVAAFMSYSRTQILQSAASEVYTMLQIARSRTLSQVKPFPQCSNKVFEGYKVVLCGFSGEAACLTNNTQYKYELEVQCGGYSYQIEQKTLPDSVSFNATLTTTKLVFFRPLTGGVEGAGTITVSFPSTTDKIIKVESDGRITVN